MIFALFFVIILFLTVMQAALPFLLRKTIVFGVTIPEGYTEDKTLENFKKAYTACIVISGIIGLVYFSTFGLSDRISEETIVFRVLIIQFIILIINMVLYLFFHIKTTKLKRDNAWGANLKQVRVADLTSRPADEMLPSLFFALPMVISLGLIAYTATQYSSLPDLIPTHWGPDGKPDAFSDKNPFSAIALLLILFVMQGMMVAINIFTKQSGVKLNAAKKNSSRIQQLSFRKYTSWFLFLTTLLMTILIGFLQLTTIHGELGGPFLMMAMPLGFLIIILLATAIYAFKVGQGGSRIQPMIEEEAALGITDSDDDACWKAGVFYVNRNDPSIFVEKRFGVGWTLNFGNPIGYLVVVGPILIILAISFLL